MRVLASVLVALALYCANPIVCEARDPWYEDVNQHWARQWVKVLWEEDVADGFIYKRYVSGWGGVYELEVSYYRPDNSTTRAELAMLLAKAFDLAPMPQYVSFTDVDPDYVLYGWKRPHPYIEAAYHHAIVKGTGGSHFSPGLTATRQEVVAMLVRGLGLAEFSGTLSDIQVADQLSRFRDGASTHPSLRREIATAVYLRIVEGYPDGTLRPAGLLTRAESAAIVARSCLIRCEANPRVFSPDGDGIQDVTVFGLKTLRNRNIREWGVQIIGSGQQVLRAWNGWALPGESCSPPASLTWNGRDYGGLACGDGLYFYQSWVRDREGLLLQSAIKPIVIERPSVWAFASPGSTYPGGAVTVTALTSGQPTAVRLEEAGTQLEPSDGKWLTTWVVPEGTTEGPLSIDVIADYPSGASREASAQVLILDPLSVDASLIPAAVMPGQRVTIRAITTPNADSVAALWPWSERQQLTRISATVFEAEATTGSLSEGSYPVVVTARAGAKSRSVTAMLIIDTSPLRRLAPVLVS